MDGLKQRAIKYTAILCQIAVLVAVVWYFVCQCGGVAFYIRRPYLIGLCVGVGLVAGVLIQAITRTGFWDTRNSNGKLRPFRLVALGWTLLVLFFAAMAPVVDTPWTAYLLAASICSFLIAVVGVGLALLGKYTMKRTLLLTAGVILLAYGSFAASVVLHAPLEFVGLFLRIIQYIVGLTIIGLTILSLCGWIKFLGSGRSGGNSGNSGDTGIPREFRGEFRGHNTYIDKLGKLQ